MKKSLLLTYFHIAIVGLYSQILVKDITPGAQSSMPYFVDSVGNGFLFYGTGTETGRELYFSDGSSIGTYMLKDIYGGHNSSNCDFSNIKMNGKVYFFARDSTNIKYGLWKTDGTKTGTVKIKSLSNETYPQFLLNHQTYANQMAVFKDKLYMNIKDANGFELWVSDGTDTGTYMLKDILSGTASSNPRGFIVYKDHLYFTAMDIDHGYELWRTDGTKSGTTLFYDIFPGNTSCFAGDNPQFFILKDRLFFKGRRNYNEMDELWVTDGTIDGTKLYKDFNPTPNISSNLRLIAQSEQFVILATLNVNNSNEIWKFNPDDSSEFTLLLSITGSVVYLNGMKLNDRVIFPAFVNNFGYEYWATDGTENGTVILKDINPGGGTGYTGYHAIVGNRLYMICQNTNFNIDIWTTDGTQDSTNIAFDLSPGIFQNHVTSMFSFRQKLYAGIMLNSSQYGHELYRFETNRNLDLTSIYEENSSTFPNPVKKGNYLTLKNVTENSDAMIIDISGKQLNILQIENGRILIPNDISSGIYILRYKKAEVIYNIRLSITE